VMRPSASTDCWICNKMAQLPIPDDMSDDVVAAVDVKSAQFSELLNKIEYATVETKKLWHEIYENANADRVHAFMLFTDLYTKIFNSAEAHGTYGKLIAQYLERMNKANDQLLKLAELIDASSTMDDEIDSDALYAEITQTK